MKVILKEDIADLGKAGDTVEVKNGYGRNYLMPRNLAIPATKANLRAIDEVTRQKVARDRKARKQAEVIRDRIEQLELSAEVLVGDEDKVFGSVGVHDIMELLAKEGVQIPKNQIELEAPLKALGVYTIPIKIEKSVSANLKLWVVKKS
ncbi:MAG TPA: 50S ribosomal protein L9 [candidate division Zixibacteria bacterium]|nr:50S ribosomal protein L9 [candidate division Zixibacteria bacterium]